MLNVRPWRGAGFAFAALLVSSLLALFTHALSQTSPPTGPTPALPFTPLHLDELGPRTETVELDRFYHVRYVVPKSQEPRLPTGEPGAPWTSLVDALTQIKDAGPRNRYAILVAAGVYPFNRLPLRPYVEIYGGFNPRGWGRDIQRYPTILDGRETGPLLLGADHARLDGFVIRNGRNEEAGGALLCRDTSPWISNNIFTANRTIATEGGGVPGGAIVCWGHYARPRIERNTFAFNATMNGQGGAIACLDGAEVRVYFNIFAGNIAGLGRKAPERTSDGGAIAIGGGAKAEIFSNLIVNNAACGLSDGGGIFVDAAGPVRIWRNIITGNDAEGNGGAIMMAGTKDFTCSANIISSNLASGGGGGLCFIAGSSGLIENCLVCENKASEGGGVAADGVTLNIHNATICKNQGDLGGGFQFINTFGVPQHVNLLNSIVFFNTSAMEIFHDDATSSITATYCNIGDPWAGAGNISEDPLLRDDYLVGQVALMEFNQLTYQTRVVLVARQVVRSQTLPGRVIRIGTKSSVIAANRQLKEIDHQELWVWGDMTGGGINRAPVSFAVLPTYRPLPDSPCIDAGSNLGPDLDLYGNARPVTVSGMQLTDIGAIEFIPSLARIQVGGREIPLSSAP